MAIIHRHDSGTAVSVMNKGAVEAEYNFDGRSLHIVIGQYDVMLSPAELADAVRCALMSLETKA